MQAGPTSLERCLELMQREQHVREQVLQGVPSDVLNTAWAALRSLATAEAKRINQLLYCVRLRAMIMPLRYQVLHDLQSFSAKPRQPVPQEFQSDMPEEANAFLESLVQVANLQHHNFVAMLKQAVEVFNRASSPGELGLDKKKFPFKIWRDHAHSMAGDAMGISGAEQTLTGGTSRKKSKHLHHTPSIGEIVRVAQTGEEGAEAMKGNGSHAYFLGFSADKDLRVQPSGHSWPVTVPAERIRACRGAAVLVPGPVKTTERMKEKLRTDYKDDPHPAAASLVDILRATIVLDDPYALAVCAAYIQKKFAAVRLKNRFASDSVKTVTVDRLLSEFYAAEAVGGSASTGSGDAAQDLGSLCGYTQQYRDVNLNISVVFPGRETEFICEVQLTLSTISILKKSEQKIYSILRMENPAELREQYVFSRKTEEDESTILTTHSVLSTATGSASSDAPSPLEETPHDYASALSAAGLTSGTPHGTPLPIVNRGSIVSEPTQAEEILTFADVAPSTVTSKAAAVALDAVPSTSITTADSYGKPVEKPLPGVMIGEANPARDAGFMQGFISSCKPCAPAVQAVGAINNSPIELAASEHRCSGEACRAG